MSHGVGGLTSRTFTQLSTRTELEMAFGFAPFGSFQAQLRSHVIWEPPGTSFQSPEG